MVPTGARDCFARTARQEALLRIREIRPRSATSSCAGARERLLDMLARVLTETKPSPVQAPAGANGAPQASFAKPKSKRCINCQRAPVTPDDVAPAARTRRRGATRVLAPQEPVVARAFEDPALRLRTTSLAVLRVEAVSLVYVLRAMPDSSRLVLDLKKALLLRVGEKSRRVARLNRRGGADGKGELIIRLL